jgi:WD40 repeat protein
MTRFLILVLVFAASAPAQELPTTDDGYPLPAGAIRRFGNRQMRHPTGISGAVISPDGKLLATASFQGVVVWDLQTLKVKRSFPHMAVGYYTASAQGGGLAFLPDSKSLVVSVRPNDNIAIQFDSKMDLTQVWDVETGKKKYSLTGTYDYYANAWPAAGGKEIVLYSNSINGNGASFRFFDAKDGKELRSVAAPQMGNPPWVGPGGNVVLVQANGQGNGIVLDVATGKELFTLPEPSRVAAFSRDGKLLVWVSAEGVVHVHDLAADKPKFTFTHPESSRPGPMVVSADNKTLYFTSNHGRLLRWDLEHNKKGPDFANRHNFWNLTGIVLSPDESLLFSVSQDHLIKRWDTKTGKELPLPEGYTTHVSQVIAGDGKHLILTDHQGQVDYYDLATGKRVKQIQKPFQGGINSLVESADGKWLAGGRTSQDIRLFDLTTGKVVRDIFLKDNGPDRWNDQVQRVAFAPNSEVVYSTSHNTGLTAWQVPDGKKLWNASGTDTILAVDPKGRWLALGGGYQRDHVQWTLIDAKSGATIARPEVESIGHVTRNNITYNYPPYVSDLGWLPDGSRLVTAHMDGTIRFWDAETRREVRRLTEDKSGTSAVLGVSADGKWLALGRSDRGVEVWEVVTGKKVLALAEHDSGVQEVAFTKDGRGLVSNADLSPILWDICPKDLPAGGLWEKLADMDGAKAYKAQWALVKNPPAAIGLFGEKVKPAELGVQRTEFDKYIAGLDSPQFRAREFAERELMKLGGRIPLGWLRTALADAKSDEVRARLGRVLARREGEPDANAWRLSRAVQVLELIGTAESKTLLKTWAAADSSPVGEDAKAALERIAMRMPVN